MNEHKKKEQKKRMNEGGLFRGNGIIFWLDIFKIGPKYNNINETQIFLLKEYIQAMKQLHTLNAELRLIFALQLDNEKIVPLVNKISTISNHAKLISKSLMSEIFITEEHQTRESKFVPLFSRKEQQQKNEI